MVAPGLYRTDESWHIDFYKETTEDVEHYMYVPDGIRVYPGRKSEKYGDTITIRHLLEDGNYVVLFVELGQGVWEAIAAPFMEIVHEGIVKVDINALPD